MPKLNFQPLFEYLDEQFAEVRHELKDIKKRISTLTNAVDTALKESKDNKQELIVVNHTLEQHDSRIEATETKLGIKFSH